MVLALRNPNHGYGIIQEVEALTEGRVVLGAGTLYGAIQTLEKKGWIRIYSVDTESRKKKEYIITETGKEVFYSEMADEGYAMTGFFAGFYIFEKCEPGEYSYKIDR